MAEPIDSMMLGKVKAEIAARTADTCPIHRLTEGARIAKTASTTATASAVREPLLNKIRKADGAYVNLNSRLLPVAPRKRNMEATKHAAAALGR